jgi:hypothetical protein
MPHNHEYIEMQDMDEIRKNKSLKDKVIVLEEIEKQLSDKSIEGHARKTILQEKETTKKAIELLKNPEITFDEYLKKMGLLDEYLKLNKMSSRGGSKKHKSKKHRSKKHRSKKHGSKMHRSKKHRSRR